MTLQHIRSRFIAAGDERLAAPTDRQGARLLGQEFVRAHVWVRRAPGVAWSTRTANAGEGIVDVQAIAGGPVAEGRDADISGELHLHADRPLARLKLVLASKNSCDEQPKFLDGFRRISSVFLGSIPVAAFETHLCLVPCLLV